MVVGRLRSTPRVALARLKEQLDTVGAPTLGAVVNAVGRGHRVRVRLRRPSRVSRLDRARAVACGRRGCGGLGADGRRRRRPRAAVDSALPPTRAIRAASPLPLRAGRIVGYVRDVNGRAGAASDGALDGWGTERAREPLGPVRAAAQPGRRTADGGSSRLHAPERRYDAAARARSPGRFLALAVTAPRRVSVANSADRLIVWTNCDALVGLREPELRRWIDLGVDGFVCQTGGLWGVGGSQRFTGDRRVRLHGEETRVQRQLRASPAVRWAGKESCCSISASTRPTTTTSARRSRIGSTTAVGPETCCRGPQRGRCSQRRWVSPGLRSTTSSIHRQSGEQTASWSVRYPGNRRSEAEVRAKVEQRGRQLMETMVRGVSGPRAGRLRRSESGELAGEGAVRRQRPAERVRLATYGSTSGTGSRAFRATRRSGGSTRSSTRPSSSPTLPGTPRSSTTPTGSTATSHGASPTGRTPRAGCT